MLLGVVRSYVRPIMFNSATRLRPISSLMRLRSTSASTTTSTTTGTSIGNDNVHKIDDSDEKLDTVQLDPDVVDNLKHPFLKTMRDRGYLFQCTNLKGEHYYYYYYYYYYTTATIVKTLPS